MEYILLLGLGIVLTAASVPNLRGDVSTVHWYNRRRVRREDAPGYGRAMGLGTAVMGLSAMATAVLQMMFDSEPVFYLLAAGVAVGLAVMVYAQFKYNKGIL